MGIRRAWCIGLAASILALGTAGAASAQGGIGIGPRMTFSRGDASLPDSSALRMLGGQLKLRMSPKTALELSLDYHSELSDDLSTRVKSYPLQASVLLHPVSTTLSPYFVGGVGWYTQRVDIMRTIDRTMDVERSVTTRRMGYHAGVGAEIRAGRHVALHGDYRYTFLGFGDETDRAPGVIPVPGTISFQERLRLSHGGSMWNWGATFFF